MRLLVAGQFRWNSGSSQVIREYVRQGPALGVEIAVACQFGSHDATIERELPFCDDLGWATHLLIIYEGSPFLAADDLACIDRVVPRARRAVVDADGHWAPLTIACSDDNAWPCGTAAWRRFLADVSDTILQPRLVQPSEGATFFPYFGLPEAEPAGQDNAAIAVQYIGNNWFRYAAVRELFGAARAALGPGARFRICGDGWDGSTLAGLEDATYADPAVLRGLGIDVQPPVAFGSVVARMGEAVLTPVLVRPVLSKLGMLTPRMLETAAAATIPVYRLEDSFIGELFGDGGALCLGSDPPAAFERIMTEAPRLRSLVAKIRRRLSDSYSYSAVLRRLIAILAS